MSRYTVNKVLKRLWCYSGNEADIAGDQFDNGSDEDYHDECGLHRGEEMACSEKVKELSRSEHLHQLSTTVTI